MHCSNRLPPNSLTDSRSSHRDPKISIGHGWSELAKQVAFVGAAVLFYFGVRGLANWIYIWGHWPVIVATLFWLHQRHRYHYLVLRNGMFVSGAIGLVIFTLYPVAPPRLADIGFIDTISTWSTSYRILQPPNLVNKYAAVPSLHVGWNLLVGLEWWRTSRSRSARVVTTALPLAMCLSVVLTGNHFVFDAVAGVVVALIGFAVAHAITLPLAGGRLADPSIPSS